MEKLRNFENSDQDTIENREQRADVLLRFLSIAKNIEPLHGQKFEAVFSDEEHKREFIKNLSAEEFLQLLNGINGILRDKKKEDWKMDGENVGVGGSVFTGLEYISPRQEDKAELLEKLLISVKEMSESGKDLKDVALAISAAINAIHPFIDGNGRTSRFLYFILSENYTSENEDRIRRALSKSASFDGAEFNINPSLIQAKIDELVDGDVGINNPEINTDKILGMLRGTDEIEFKQEIDEKEKNLFKNLYEIDKDYLLLAVFNFLSNNPDFNKDECVQKRGRGAVVLAGSLSQELNQEQLSQILQNYRELKKKYVEKLIGSIASPDSEEYQVEEDGQKISLKTYFEGRIKKDQEKRVEEEKVEKEKQEVEQRERERIDEKELLIKSRFDKGEGTYKNFEASEVVLFREAEQFIAKIAEESSGQEYSDEQKVDILKQSLFTLAGKINSEVSISQEQIDKYVENKKTELLELFYQFQKASEIMSYLESSGVFDYKIHTSSDDEIPYAEQDDLAKKDDISVFLDELISQSVYYVGSNGSSLRIKLFEIKSKNVANIIQPTMEQIFYNDEMVDYIDKQVIKVSDLTPEQRKFVFEIVTPEFRQKVLSQEGSNQEPIKSRVGIISDEEGIYVKIPEGATLHSGWRIVGIKKLKE